MSRKPTPFNVAAFLSFMTLIVIGAVAFGLFVLGVFA